MAEMARPTFGQLRVRGFRRLRSLDLQLRPFTVLIGANGLRCSATISGFGSHVSMCDKPPCSRITSTFFAFGWYHARHPLAEVEGHS